jgi:serine/threonine protein kinase
MLIEAGQQLLHYRLIEKIGEGGMGVVWKAEDTRLHRHVALKFVPEDKGQNTAIVDRHLREARSPTCRRSRPWARNWTNGRISSHWVQCCTK